MSIGPPTEPISDRAAGWVVFIVCALILFMALVNFLDNSAHEDCLNKCEEIHQTDVHNACHPCRSLCDEKFGVKFEISK